MCLEYVHGPACTVVHSAGKDSMIASGRSPVWVGVEGWAWECRVQSGLLLGQLALTAMGSAVPGKDSVSSAEPGSASPCDQGPFSPLPQGLAATRYGGNTVFCLHV